MSNSGARTFNYGDIIPADTAVIQTALGEVIPRYDHRGFGTGEAWGVNDTSAKGYGAWVKEDFPLTELIGEV